MQKFKISDIQEIFTSDVERFHRLTQQHVSQLLNEPVSASAGQEALDEALRQCHTLKGLAATVEAWGLSCLGADFEKLLELAGSWMHNEREKANEVFQFILEHMQDWFVMNQFSCMEMLPQAWDIYQGLRVVMDERWPGYLPRGAEGLDAQYVRLADLEISEVEASSELAVPDSNLAELSTSTSQRSTFNEPGSRNLELGTELDVQGAQPTRASDAGGVTGDAKSGLTSHGAPLPVRVVPPVLRHREAVENEPLPSEPTLHADAPATPKPLQVVPPTLRRRDASPAAPATPVQESPGEIAAMAGSDDVSASISASEAAKAETPIVPGVESVGAPAPVEASAAQTELPQAEQVSDSTTAGPAATSDATAATTAGSSTPPLLRVARPALKRRGKSKETERQRDGDVAHTSAEPVRPVADSPVSAEALSAEAIFAALPESVEAAPVEQVGNAERATTAGEFKPGDDADLLVLLSHEVAGYLTELAGSLTVLAGDLSGLEAWEKTRRLFHTIKGTAATFGLDAVSAPAKAAELRCLAAVEAIQNPQPSTLNQFLKETFELCAHLAGSVARSLHLPFDEGRLREALELGFAQAANVAAASAPVAALDAEMAGFFVNDTRDQLGIIEQAVLRWEKVSSTSQVPSSKLADGQRGTRNAELECIQAAQRGFHTIKGAGNSIGLTGVANSVHEVESFLEELAGKLSSELADSERGTNQKAIFTFLLGAVDQLRRYLVGLAKNPATPWRQDWSTALGLLREASDSSKLQVESCKLDSKATQPATSNLERATDDGDDAQTIRIETARLYQLMNLVSEMVIDRARLARKIEQLAALHRALAERNGALTGSVMNFQEQFEFNLMQQAAAEANAERGTGNAERGAGSAERGTRNSELGTEFSELEFDRYDQFNVLARSLVEIGHDIEQLNGDVAACLDSFVAENAHFAHTSQELQSQVTSLGLVPVKTLFPRLQRAFRDACDVEGKEAELELSGGETMLDKVVVDKVYAPLLHLLRNAVAHGIEDGATRSERKKSAAGRVWLSAAQVSNQIVLQLSDDGGGVDAAAVRGRAIEKGWLGKDAPELSAEQVVEFIFKPGFSTASKVTSVSGRGIGLDVVRQEVENLNGSVELKFVAGEGATWTLRLPLTLSISEAILAELGGTQYAFPLNFVEAGLILEPERLVRNGEGGAEQYPVERRNLELGTANPDAATEVDEGPKFDLLPVLRLSRLFGVPGNGSSDKGLIASVGDRRAIVVVDVVLRRQEIVVKQLDAVMAQHPLLNGASVDAEGRVIPILNLPTLLKFGEQLSSRTSASAMGLENVKRTEQTRVLVVDDSLSVRKVQERYFKDLGCQVTVASDGLVALERLREQEFDLIFTDLEMPRLNGYELISEVRGNPAWAQVPVVVISSRGADKYITKAMNVGASTFLSKPFTQGQLKQVLGHYARK